MNQLEVRRILDQAKALLSHDPGQAGRLAAATFLGLVIIGLWGLYGDLFFSNLAVVTVTEMLVIGYVVTVACLAGTLVRSYDRWQVESALTLRELLSEGPESGASPLVGSPFYTRQLRLRLEEDIRRCKDYGTRLTVVAVRLELSSQRPSRASFTQANFDMAQLATSHRDLLAAPTALGMFEYAFVLPNCGLRGAKAVTTFIARALHRYRCSFGLAIFPGDGEDSDTLLRHAVEGCGMLDESAA